MEVHKCQENTQVLVMKPNNGVMFVKDGIIRYGFVKDIIGYTMPGMAKRVVLNVEVVENLFCKDTAAKPPLFGRTFRLWLYQMKVVIGRLLGACEMVPASCFQHVVCYWKWPPGKFGIASKGFVISAVNHEPLLNINNWLDNY